MYVCRCLSYMLAKATRGYSYLGILMYQVCSLVVPTMLSLAGRRGHRRVRSTARACSFGSAAHRRRPYRHRQCLEISFGPSLVNQIKSPLSDHRRLVPPRISFPCYFSLVGSLETSTKPIQLFRALAENCQGYWTHVIERKLSSSLRTRQAYRRKHRKPIAKTRTHDQWVSQY